MIRLTIVGDPPHRFGETKTVRTAEKHRTLKEGGNYDNGEIDDNSGSERFTKTQTIIRLTIVGDEPTRTSDRKTKRAAE